MKRIKNDSGWLGWFVAAIFAIVICFSIYTMTLPLDAQLEIRCRAGDSVACLSLPR